MKRNTIANKNHIHNIIHTDLYSKYHVCDDEPILLSIIDTPGRQEYLETLGKQWIRESEIFILVFAVNSPLQSASSSTNTPFEQCTVWRDKILQVKQTRRAPIILVGNKCDIAEPDRTIPRSKGEELADEWHCPYIETSAKSWQGLQELFDEVVHQYHTAQLKMETTTFEFDQNGNSTNSRPNPGPIPAPVQLPHVVIVPALKINGDHRQTRKE